MVGTDSVRDCGGDSIDALVIGEHIATEFKCDPPLAELLDGATVQSLASTLTPAGTG